MAHYHWKGINKNGEIHHGMLESKTRKFVWQRLINESITPLRIKRNLFHQTMKKSMLVDFTQQLTLLLKANIPLEKSLKLLESAEKKPEFYQFIRQIHQKIQSGKNLATALSEYPQYCSSDYCAFIKTGETTGKLCEALQHLLSLIQARQKLQAELKKAFSYPLFLFICTLVISGGILGFVIPEYQDFFSTMGSTLPRLTQAVLKFSTILKNCKTGLFMTLTITTILILTLLKQKKTRNRVDQLSLKIPWLKQLIIKITLTRWCYLLGIALKTRIPILSALMISNASINNRYLKEKFNQLPEKLRQGNSLFESLKKINLLRPELLQLVLIGENSGTMDLIFSKMAEIYQHDLTQQLSKLAKRAEPAAILILAGITGLIIAALYLPMVNLGLTLK